MSSNGPPLRKMNEMLLSVALPTDKMEDKALQLILKAPKEAVNLSSSSGSSQLGTVGDAVAAAKSTAQVSKEIQEVIKISFRDALGSMSSKSSDGDIDDVMKEIEKKIKNKK